jgi:O-antigen/teichoic acid export membrane protein
VREFFKHAAVYGLAMLLVQAGSFILLPIYLRCLTPGEYGLLEILGRVAETVGTFLLLGGFRQALLTFHQQAETEVERRRIVSTTLTLVLCTCVLGGAILLALSPVLGHWLAGFLGGGTPVGSGLLRLAIVGILLEPLSAMPLALLQARMESTAYVCVVVSQLLVRVVLSIILVRGLGWGVEGALLATALTGALFGAGLCGREVLRARVWPDPRQVCSLVRFALPMMPGGFCFFLLHHGDRFFLCRYCPPAEVGIYALGYKLGMIVAVFSLNPLYMVWSSRMYAVARQPDAPEAFGRMFTRILAAYLLVGLGLCLFGGEVVRILGGAAYASAVRIIAPVVLACFFQAGAALMDAGLYVRHCTVKKLGITLASTLVMLVLYGILIPTHGGMGAALATLGGFGFLAVSTWWVSQQVFPVRYEWSRLTGLLALAIGLWLVGESLPPGTWSLAGKAGLWLLAPVLVWVCGLISDEEQRQIEKALRHFITSRGVTDEP